MPSLAFNAPEVIALNCRTISEWQSEEKQSRLLPAIIHAAALILLNRQHLTNLNICDFDYNLKIAVELRS